LHLVGGGCHPASVEEGQNPLLRPIGSGPNKNIGAEYVTSDGDNVTDSREDYVSLLEIADGAVARRQVGPLVKSTEAYCGSVA